MATIFTTTISSSMTSSSMSWSSHYDVRTPTDPEKETTEITASKIKENDEEETKIYKGPLPLNCLTCRDNDEKPCKECGCYLCAGKHFPERILLCDECNRGFHMDCLKPALTELPLGDWYCKSCKRNPNEVVAPGAAKQKKREITTNRDWGRGMACVGRTKTCSMPPNHFGPIPGIEVGMCWRFRIQLSESGVHRPPASGIHGRDVEGAFSIVLSGGYEDDVDYGNEFTYTGSGGRDLSGNKRTAEQSCDQTLTRENKALARNCAVKKVNEEGDDAGEDWREGRPVRVVRSCKMLKHFPKYAPKEGIRYDGIYKVVKYYPEKGKSSFRVKYLLRRDDPCPAPWEPGAKHYDIIYPDGYLEAEAEKKALKEKTAKVSKGKGRQTSAAKRVLQESNHSAKEETMQLAKKPKASKGVKKEPLFKSTKSSPKVKDSEAEPGGSKDCAKSILSEEEKKTIASDTLNAKLMEERLERVAIDVAYMLGACRTPLDIQPALDKGILDALVPALTVGGGGCKQHAALAIRYLCERGSPAQLRELAASAALQPYCRMLTAGCYICLYVLCGLTNLLMRVEETTKLDLLLKLRALGVPQLLLPLKQHSDRDIHDRANHLMQTYFSGGQ